MKRMLALLLTAMLILTLLPGCGKKDPGGDAPEVPENPTEQGGETPDVTPEPEPYVDPYEAVRTYWSEDQLTQSWGPDQIVEHLFFHPVIAYPQWAFHDCGASQSERYGLDDWMVTADEYAKILQSVYEKGYILVAIEDVWSEVTDESGTHMVRNTLKLPEGKKPLITVGVNPSTAAPDDLDNTLKSVERIARRNGFDSFIMFNVYAQRATSPDDMDKERDERLHSENMRAFDWVLSHAGAHPAVWAAWGAVIEKRRYLPDCVRDMLLCGERYGAVWYTAGARSKAKGHPHHPLYLRRDSVPEPFDVRAYCAAQRARLK